MKLSVLTTVAAITLLSMGVCAAQQEEGPADNSPPPFVTKVQAKPKQPESNLNMDTSELQEAIDDQESTTRKVKTRKLSPEELIESWMVENGQVDKTKAKARTYQEHIERETTPKGRVRTVYPPLDEAEVTVRCSVNYATLIRLPGTVTEKDIAIGNKDRFAVEIYQDGRTLVLNPKAPFKSTNAHLMLDGGNRIVHLLLEENANRSEVDYQVNIMYPPSQAPNPAKLMRFLAYDKLPDNEFEVSGGMGASLTKVNKKLCSGFSVIRKLDVQRPERMIGYALQVPGYSKDLIKPVDAAYYGELSAGEFFVFFRHTNGKIEIEGKTYVLP